MDSVVTGAARYGVPGLMGSVGQIDSDASNSVGTGSGIFFRSLLIFCTLCFSRAFGRQDTDFRRRGGGGRQRAVVVRGLVGSQPRRGPSR